MKKSLIFVGMLTGILATAQTETQTQDYNQRVGINTTTPRASLEVRAVNFDGRIQGILFPYISETEKAKWTKDKDKGLVAGTVIWNISKVCLDYFDGDKWQCTDGTKKNTHPTSWFDVATLEISPLAFSGEYKDGKVFTNANTVKFKLKNTGTEAITNLNLTNAVTIVNGTATITATGQNTDAITIPAGGKIEITYILSGKPEEGLLTATLSYESKTASNSTTVTEQTATLPDEVIIKESKHTIFSMYDKNYFPFTAPTSIAIASWEINVNPDTTNEPLIDIQGKIPATGLTVKIPITYSGSGITTLPAYTSKAVAIDPKGEQGVTNSTRKLILSWDEQNITNSTTYITAKITPEDGQILNVTKLDLNAGLGGDLKGTLLTEFFLPESNIDTTIKVPFTIRVTPAIPDKNYFTDDNHKFFYLPVRAEDGKVWLNNNLGADYAKYGDAYFDPSQQATMHNDWRAYGSLFQWQRKADGHELIKRSASDPSGNNGKSEETTTLESTWNAGHSNFIKGKDYWTTVYANTNKHNLWKSQGTNNPCPTNFHVPTDLEWSNLFAMNNSSEQGYRYWSINSPLKLVINSNVRSGLYGTLGQMGGTAYYHSSDYYIKYTLYEVGFSRSSWVRLSDGSSVRCIAD